LISSEPNTPKVRFLFQSEHYQWGQWGVGYPKVNLGKLIVSRLQQAMELKVPWRWVEAAMGSAPFLCKPSRLAEIASAVPTTLDAGSSSKP
jgi:hypothetical protein